VGQVKSNDVTAKTESRSSTWMNPGKDTHYFLYFWYMKLLTKTEI
jgi:hypothetical protein